MDKLVVRVGKGDAVPCKIDLDFALDLDDKTWEGIQDIFNALADVQEILGDNYDLERLRELVEADKIPVDTRKFVEKMDKEAIQRWMNRSTMANGISDERLKEICQADLDGRCVVLPKDGMVYYIEQAAGEKWVANKPIQQITVKCGWGVASIEFSLFDTGKYFTREAAEAALKGEKDG